MEKLISNPPEGILLVDKNAGPTSFDVVAQVRRALHIKSVGHTGTLDPFATGLLVILVGRYTRLCDHLTGQNKTYLARVCFGQGTTTDDIEGEVIANGNADLINEANLHATLKTFLGEQMQVPPQFSAISIGGERAYKKARRGEAVDLSARNVVIHHIKLLQWSTPYADIEVMCSKGTYIRAIARDLGQKLGVPAHLSALRRVASGSYHIDNALPQDALVEPLRAQAALQKGADSILDIKKITIDSEMARQLRQGQHPHYELADKDEGTLLACCDAEPVALAKVTNNRLIPLRCF